MYSEWKFEKVNMSFYSIINKTKVQIFIHIHSLFFYRRPFLFDLFSIISHTLPISTLLLL
jgi:hypothetical protein